MLRVMNKPDEKEPKKLPAREEPEASAADSPTHMDDDDVGLPKLDQACVVYMGGEAGPFRCDRCVYWEGPDKCHIVSGHIDPDGCCNLFVRPEGAPKTEDEPHEGEEAEAPEAEPNVED